VTGLMEMMGVEALTSIFSAWPIKACSFSATKATGVCCMIESVSGSISVRGVAGRVEDNDRLIEEINCVFIDHFSIT